jgi:hypothetical protein
MDGLRERNGRMPTLPEHRLSSTVWAFKDALSPRPLVCLSMRKDTTDREHHPSDMQYRTWYMSVMVDGDEEKATDQ